MFKLAQFPMPIHEPFSKHPLLQATSNSLTSLRERGWRGRSEWSQGASIIHNQVVQWLVKHCLFSPQVKLQSVCWDSLGIHLPKLRMVMELRWLDTPIISLEYDGWFLWIVSGFFVQPPSSCDPLIVMKTRENDLTFGNLPWFHCQG